MRMYKTKFLICSANIRSRLWGPASFTLQGLSLFILLQTSDVTCSRPVHQERKITATAYNVYTVFTQQHDVRVVRGVAEIICTEAFMMEGCLVLCESRSLSLSLSLSLLPPQTQLTIYGCVCGEEKGKCVSLRSIVRLCTIMCLRICVGLWEQVVIQTTFEWESKNEFVGSIG